MAVVGENTSVQNIGPVISFEDAWEKEIKYREWIKSSSHFHESRSSYLLFATSEELPPNRNVDERKTEKVLPLPPMNTVSPLLSRPVQQQQTSAPVINYQHHQPHVWPGPLQSRSRSLPTQTPVLAQEFNCRQEPASSIKKQPYWCSLCQVPCTSKFNYYKSHCQGISHKSKQAQIRASSSSHFLISRLWCSVCALQCSSQIHYEQHCRGKSHMSKLQGQASSSDPLTSQFWCSLCQVQCPCQVSYEYHCRGKKHNLRLDELCSSAVGLPN